MNPTEYCDNRLFGNPKLSKLDKFKTDLRNLVIKHEQVTNKEVLEFTLSRGFEPKQAAIVLREMKKSNQIEHFSHPKIGCKQVYKDNDIVIFKKQL